MNSIWQWVRDLVAWLRSRIRKKQKIEMVFTFGPPRPKRKE